MCEKAINSVFTFIDGPENSIEALRLAARNGARMVEFDLRKV